MSNTIAKGRLAAPTASDIGAIQRVASPSTAMPIKSPSFTRKSATANAGLRPPPTDQRNATSVDRMLACSRSAPAAMLAIDPRPKHQEATAALPTSKTCQAPIGPARSAGPLLAGGLTRRPVQLHTA